MLTQGRELGSLIGVEDHAIARIFEHFGHQAQERLIVIDDSDSGVAVRTIVDLSPLTMAVVTLKHPNDSAPAAQQ